MVDINSKNLSEQLTCILRAVLRIIPRAAVAHPNIQKAVWPKFDHAAIVVCVRLRNQEQHFFCRAGDVG